jgi:hypothetical protein
MNKKLLNYSIYIIFIVGLFGAGNLAYHEFSQEGTCPKLGFLPACYIIFSCLIIPFISHIINKVKVVYYLFTGIALAIATYATMGQLFGNVQCPKTESGIPMCYISFMIFASLVLLKLVLSKMNR